MKLRILTILSLLIPLHIHSEDESVTDICGNTYPVVKIGEQYWIAENMRCYKYDTNSEAYNNGIVTIPTSDKDVFTPFYLDATDKKNWNSSSQTDSGTLLSDDQVSKLGYHYNWAAAVGVDDGGKSVSKFIGARQGICPNGFHIPTSDEWQILINFVGHKVAAKKLKTATGWNSYNNDNGTNEYNFSMLPSGNADNGLAYHIGANASFWSCTRNPLFSDGTYSFMFHADGDALDRTNGRNKYARSVRCVKDISSDVIEISDESTSPAFKQFVNGKVVVIYDEKQYDLNGIEIK